MKPILLRTKLFTPTLRSDGIVRPHLTEQIERGLQGKLTLVSAPAGFGKTSLISEWIASTTHPVAWLSLDEADRDPIRFLMYVASALQTAESDWGQELFDILASSPPPPVESILTPFLNALATLSQKVVLVLDDYHTLDSPSVDEVLTFLLDNQPPQIHLIITTREDPPFPLARYRARNQLTELRAADLRFTEEETDRFLTEAMALTLSQQAVDMLQKRTEGWIVGLHLAALSLQGIEDKTAFIASFAGTHHFVLDYLLEEVLDQQPEHIRTFLLQTSILDRMTASLCDAITGRTDSQEILASLTRSNLFVIPLDNAREWYRYHHLFGELLRQRLYKYAANDLEVTDLHTQASVWFEENGLPVDAFNHATQADDIERAERLMNGNGMPLYFQGAIHPVLAWLEGLPQSVFDGHPSLWVSYATASTLTGRQIDDVEEKLHAAENALRIMQDDAFSRDLQGQIAANRTMQALSKGQVETVIEQGQQALAYLHVNNHAMRTTVNWALGYAYQLQGNHATARQAYTDTIRTSETTGNTMITIGSWVSLGQIEEADTHLHVAKEMYERVLILAGAPPLLGANEAHLGLARIFYEWNDLDAAWQHAELSYDLSQHINNVDTPGMAKLLMARILFAQGKHEAALKAVAEAEHFLQQGYFEHQLPEAAAIRIFIYLQQGNVIAVDNLAQAYDLPLSRASVYLANNEPSHALQLLDSHKESFSPNERFTAILLQALSLYEMDEVDTAIDLMREALSIAVTQGFRRRFLDQGIGMARLLSEAAHRGVMPDYARELVATFVVEDAETPSQNQSLVEPLTDRELDVLALLAQGLSNREISHRLFIALDTVKGHNRRIYAKLQVKRRTEAILRAQELGLI